ncbi:MAG: DUF6144 family protein [Candidatus Bathyarchaeia archaeon]
MGKAQKHGMIRTIEGSVARFAGETTRRKVMEGSEEMTEDTDLREIALWVKGAMDRLDKLADQGTRIQIMENCGYGCASVNRRYIEEAIASRRRYKNIDDFLEGEQRTYNMYREGDVVYQVYSPQTQGVRCNCELVQALPEDEKISPTYCHCSKGFVKKWWEGVLERPVKVDIIQSVVSGAQECKFAIHLRP